MVHALRVDRVTTTPALIALRFMRTVDVHGTPHRGQDLQDWTITVSPHADPQRPATHAAIGAFTSSEDALLRTLLLYVGNTEPDSLESFAEGLANALLAEHDVTAIHVHLSAHLWRRVVVQGTPHPSTYMKGSDECQTATCTVSRNSILRRSGFDDMTLLTAAMDAPSAAGLIPDAHELAFLRLSASWSYSSDTLVPGFLFQQHRYNLREHLISSFAALETVTLPQALQVLADAVFQADQTLTELTLQAPNNSSLAELLEGRESEDAVAITLRRG